MRGDYHFRQFDAVISHNLLWSDPNIEIVERIAVLLREGGVNVWCDIWFMEIGMDMHLEELEALRATRIQIIFVDKSERTWRERMDGWMSTTGGARALQSRTDVTIIPLLLPGVEESKIPDELNSANHIRLVDSSLEECQRVAADVCRRVVEVIGRPERPRIFLCHAKEDDDRVRSLYNRLQSAGCDPWYDKEKLDVGDDWWREIKAAIEETDFFAICLSRASVAKRGFVQKEIRAAINDFQLRAFDLAFLLPIRFDECDIPNIEIDGTTTLRSIQWVDLWRDDSVEFERILRGIWKHWKRKKRAD